VGASVRSRRSRRGIANGKVAAPDNGSGAEVRQLSHSTLDYDRCGQCKAAAGASQWRSHESCSLTRIWWA
jgi:hypothetical protein